ncbi:unnamed protein product [Oikopleura dioica]|uniref:Uncharacterized protein n=1 Tax=Oikopleura dioica TaxID=34765 RepID=E4XPP3_OIKDI|nr:unnamed protein product [Oikopleura dioica]
MPLISFISLASAYDTIAEYNPTSTSDSMVKNSGFEFEIVITIRLQIISHHAKGDEVDQLTAHVFDENDFCKLNGQVNAAINSYARHHACEGRGKVYRQIIRSARKVKKFFNRKNEC